MPSKDQVRKKKQRKRMRLTTIQQQRDHQDNSCNHRNEEHFQRKDLENELC